MTEVPPIPPLAVTYIKGLSVSVGTRGWRAYVPMSFLFAVGVAATSFIMVPKAFWEPSNAGNAIMTYGGLLTFSGILLAVGWSSFSKVFEVLGRGNMSRMLKEKGILDVHFMYVSISNLLLIAFAIICAVGLVSLSIGKDIVLDRIILALMCGTGLMAITATFNMNNFLQRLIWDEIYYD